MPPIGLALGGVDFSNYMVVLKADPDAAKTVAIRYGVFLNAIIKFVLTAFAIFILVKAMNTAEKRFGKAGPWRRCRRAAAAPANGGLSEGDPRPARCRADAIGRSARWTAQTPADPATKPPPLATTVRERDLL